MARSAELNLRAGYVHSVGDFIFPDLGNRGHLVLFLAVRSFRCTVLAPNSSRSLLRCASEGEMSKFIYAKTYKLIIIIEHPNQWTIEFLCNSS